MDRLGLEEAIKVRRSRRAYIPRSLDPKMVADLQQLIDRYTREAGIRIELVLDNGDAFDGLTKSYGMFTGVRHYLGLIADKGDAAADERLGYYGELLVLNAVAMGLGTCWVGGSFNRASCPFVLSGNERIECTIAVGYTELSNSTKEKLIYRIVRRKTKSIEEMCEVEGTDKAPDWFMSGMQAVQMAPSAANQQAVRFLYKEGQVSAYIEDPDKGYNAMDLGIAKCHFEIGAGGGTWEWGNHGSFKPHGE